MPASLNLTTSAMVPNYSHHALPLQSDVLNRCIRMPGDRPPRLLIVTTVPLTLQMFFLPFARFFSAKGWHVDAMASDVSSCRASLHDFNRLWDIPWSRNPLASSNLLQAPARVREVVLNVGYDIVHVNTPVAAFVSRMALRNLSLSQRPSVIYTAHGFHFFPGGNFFSNALFLGLERVAGLWTDYLVVVNREDFASARKFHLVPSDRLIHIPGVGVDTHRLSPELISTTDITRAQESIGLAPGVPLFLLVADFNPGKRHHDALHAFARLSHRTPHLAFAGQGPLLPHLQYLAHKLDIADRVHFLGYRRDIPILIRAADALIHCSEREGLPVSIMEALSLESSVIGTDIRGTHDLLADGCGLLVPVGGVDQLRAAMDWVLDHPLEAKEMGRCGRRRMQQSYDLCIVLQMYESLYNHALLDRSAFTTRRVFCP